MRTDQDVPEVVRRWFAIAESRDTTGLEELLAEDVVFKSPAVFKPVPGRIGTTAYLEAAVVVLGPTLTYVEQWFNPTSAVLQFTAEVDGAQVEGVDIIEWDHHDRITGFTVMVRPHRALMALIEAMSAELSR